MVGTERKPGVFRRLIGFIWRAIDGLRRLVLNLIFVLILGVLAAAFLASRGDGVLDGSVLMLRPGGQLVEQTAVSDPLNLLRRGASPEQTQVRDLLEAIKAASTDDRIRALAIETDDLTAAGLAKLEELRAALEAFRASGKPILAWGSHFTQGQYYLASQADEVFMAPDGFALVQGFASYPTYFRGALDKLGVRVQVFRVGGYKSAVEPYTRSDMSPEDRNATGSLLGALWSEWKAGVAEHRAFSAAELDALATNYPARLTAVGGDTARLALETRLVDGLKTADQWEALLIERFGADDDGKRARRTHLGDYLAAIDRTPVTPEAVVAVVAVQGTIVDGEQPPGVAGGDTIARLLRSAREDEAVKALVLRVDSPGGSVFASERIRREVQLVREAGKPVVVSMSALAAPGGYWIATAADEVWASPGTLTGSIGIFGMFPDFSETLARLGVTVDGVGTSAIAGGLDPRRPLTPALGAALQSSVDQGYRRFVGLVAEARELDPAKVDALAQGRVWTGRQAQERGLVDHLGGLHDALAAAAGRARLDAFEVRWIEPQLSPQDELLSRLLRSSGISLALPAARGTLAPMLAGLLEELQLERWNDPLHAYAHCLCSEP